MNHLNIKSFVQSFRKSSTRAFSKSRKSTVVLAVVSKSFAFCWRRKVKSLSYKHLKLSRRSLTTKDWNLSSSSLSLLISLTFIYIPSDVFTKFCSLFVDCLRKKRSRIWIVENILTFVFLSHKNIKANLILLTLSKLFRCITMFALYSSHWQFVFITSILSLEMFVNEKWLS